MNIIDAIVVPQDWAGQQARGFVHIGQRDIYPQIYVDRLGNVCDPRLVPDGKWVIPEGARPDWTRFEAVLAAIDPMYAGRLLIDVESWPLQQVNIGNRMVVRDMLDLVRKVQYRCPNALQHLYNVWNPEVVNQTDGLAIALYVGTNESREEFVQRCLGVYGRAGAWLNTPLNVLHMPRTKGGWMIEPGDWRQLLRLDERHGVHSAWVWGLEHDREAFEPYLGK